MHYTVHVITSIARIQVELLLKEYPPAVEHLSKVKGGILDGFGVCSCLKGLPLHYYVSRTSKIDIDTVELLVEAYPQSLLVTATATESDVVGYQCYPIHVAVCNASTNNLRDIIEYLLEFNSNSLRVLDECDSTPLRLACR